MLFCIPGFSAVLHHFLHFQCSSLFVLFKIQSFSRVLVAYAYNPSYSGGRDQEDCGSKPAWANSSARPYLKKKIPKKRACEVAQGIGPEFKLQYHKK
jgi:hypothetical protein